MIKSKLQHELISRGVSYKGYALLNYLRENMFTDVKGAELQTLRPMFFKDAKCVKQAFDELENAEIIKGQYKSGNIFDIEANRDLILQMSDISSGIKIEKKDVKKKATAKLAPDEVLDIAKHYNSYPTLPRPSTLTPLAISTIQDKLKVYSPEDIKDALTFASEQKWLISKGSATWCNISWVMSNIDGFMVGGKYRKDKDSVSEYTHAYVSYDDGTEVIF